MSGLSDGRRRLLGRLRTRRTREREALVLLEGPRGVREAWAAGAVARFALTSPRLDALDPDLADELAGWCEVVRLSDAELAAVSATEAPQGVLAVVVEPGDGWVADVGPDTRLLVLDAVQDPGNVGTLIRTAAAFDLDGVVLLDGCVDPWNPKAVRGSAGAAFRCPVALRSWTAIAPLLEGAGLPLWVADAAGAGPADSVRRGGWALFVGSEGRGVRSEIRHRATGLAAIPMPGGTESLNAAVAGSILVYEFTRPEGGLGA
ncbi:MAG: RNA methyltransferase [Gemmatimonadetes bacterium]|nr:RNA methyltransferase [Gemmatimonadota bacterium]